MPDPKSKAVDGRFRRPLLQGALAVAATAMVVVPAPALAATYLKLGDIKGESVDVKHKDQIEILSFTQSWISPFEGGFGGAGVGKVQCGPVTMMKNIDKSSPLLLKGVATGEYFDTAVVSFGVTDSTGRAASDYYTISMDNVFVTELSQTDEKDPNRIFEKLVLNAQVFTFKYQPQSAKGSLGDPVIFKWDCAQNKGT
ncbi:MAG: type VI secretion system tube protein Hcp [Usitatibacter sp.]